MTDFPNNSLKAAVDVSGLCRKLANPPDVKLVASACCWSDLLGFGEPFYRSNWEPTAKEWEKQSKRIANAHLQCYSNLEPLAEFVMTLNDGIVRCCDEDRFQHLDYLSMWLRACIWTHNAINESEKTAGFPGARTVLTAGRSLKYSYVSIRHNDFVYDYSKSDPTQLSSSARLSGNPVIAINPGPLQMNLAFSKAYILESSGSKVGLGGGHFFVDESFMEFARALHRRVKSGFRIIDTQNENTRLFALSKRDDDSRFHFGFELAQPSIIIANRIMTSRVWRLLSFYPWDEDIRDFKNPVE